jgi:uncharacterized protein YjiS (DUF1127 family)
MSHAASSIQAPRSFWPEAHPTDRPADRQADRQVPGTAVARRAPDLPERTAISLPAVGGASTPGTPKRQDLWARLRAAWHRHQTRRCLADLDAAALKDIGISFAEAEAEANKPFWVV